MTRRRTRTASTAALALALAALSTAAAQPAAAAPSWLAPAAFELPSTPPVQDAAIGFGAGRQLYAVEPLAGAAQSIGVYARAAGAGSGTTPALQASFPSVTGGRVTTPRLAVAASGAAVLAWADGAPDAGGPLLMRAAYRTPDGTWQEPITVVEGVTSGPSVPGQLPPFAAEVAIGADGTAAVVAQHGGTSMPGSLQWSARLDAVVHRAGAAGWEQSTQLTAPGGSASAVNVAVADAGDVTVAWADRYGEGATNSLEDDVHTAVVRRWGVSNGVWDARQDVAGFGATPGSDDDADGLALGVAGDGAAVLAYTSRVTSPRPTIATFAARRAAGGGGFATARLVATGRRDTTPLAATVAPDGVATVLWRAPSVTNGAAAGIGATRASGVGAWGTPRLLSAYPEQESTGAIAFSGPDTVLAWSASGGDTQVLQGARWRADADSPEPVRDLDAQLSFVQLHQLVGDGEGGVLAVSARADWLRTAVFDAGAPLLRSVQVPATAVAGTPVALSADVVDRWSPLDGAPRWEFGDGGAAAAGASVTHVFTAAGERTVTLRSRDALGNELTRSFPVHVDAAPVVGPQPPPRRATPPAAPRVTFTAPKCAKRLSRRACVRFRATRAAWRTVRGGASGTKKVELRISQPVAAKRGKHGKRGRHARSHVVVRRAAVRRGTWSLRLPAIHAGRLTLRLRALDARGRPVGRAVVRTLRLR